MLFGQPGRRRVLCIGLLLAGLTALPNPLGDAAGQDNPTQPHSQASQAPLAVSVAERVLLSLLGRGRS